MRYGICALFAFGLSVAGTLPDARPQLAAGATASNVDMPRAPPVVQDAGAFSPRPPAAGSVMPREIWASTRDVRALAADKDAVWMATGGGLQRVSRNGGTMRLFGSAEGLDTRDVRRVSIDGADVVADTGTGRCRLRDRERFVCQPAAASAPLLRSFELFRGYAMTARLKVGDDVFIATRGGGAYRLPHGVESEAIGVATTTDHAAATTTSFVQTAAHFGHDLWLGTFDDGLYRVPLDDNGRLGASFAAGVARVESPVRMVNRLAATGAALYVAGNEGLFSTRDGVKFSRVTALRARAITGLATSSHGLWVTSTETAYRLSTSGDRVERSVVYPAGSHAIQAITVGADGIAWLATEDRGVVRIDDRGARALDRLEGLPTSWFVAIESDGSGGALAPSLRHGTVHVKADQTWESLAWAPSPWGLGVARDDERVCVATQSGATCQTNGKAVNFSGLPDPRAHTLIALPGSLLVGTEAGLAVYTL